VDLLKHFCGDSIMWLFVVLSARPRVKIPS
jgi:hypothetical protein